MKETLGINPKVEAGMELGRPTAQTRAFSGLGSSSPRAALAFSALAATSWFKEWLMELVAKSLPAQAISWSLSLIRSQAPIDRLLKQKCREMPDSIAGDRNSPAR